MEIIYAPCKNTLLYIGYLKSCDKALSLMNLPCYNFPSFRYYYKRQILAPVLGKRLIYRFGPKSYGWNWPRDPRKVLPPQQKRLNQTCVYTMYFAMTWSLKWYEWLKMPWQFDNTYLQYSCINCVVQVMNEWLSSCMYSSLSFFIVFVAIC